MAGTLKDDSKPAGYVFPEDVKKDGSATTNGGTKLKSAQENKWYILATIAGEQKVGAQIWEFDDELAKNNRRYWNGWSCAKLDDEARTELAKKMNLSVEDLLPLKPDELKKVTDELQRRLGDNKAALPDPDDIIDFSETYFMNLLGFMKYVISGDANLNTATFSGLADFDTATFSGPAYFKIATFSGFASFNTATFSGPAYFGSAEFKSTTDFQQAKFLSYVPEFHAAKLYDHTLFTLPDGDPSKGGFWPPLKGDGKIEVMPAEKQKAAYNRLRLFMNKSLQTESEQFFHRREMACKKETEGGFMFCVYWLYDKLSDYGNSVGRPMVWLAVNILTGWVVFAQAFSFKSMEVGVTSQASAFGVSFSNVFSFLGLGRLYLREFYLGLATDYGYGLVFFSGLQTVLGFIFLILLGLGLRSRFRLR